MAKNSNTGMMRKAAVMFAAMGSMLSPGMGKTMATHHANTEAVVQNISNKNKREKLPFVSGQSSHLSSYKRGGLNQRQYRKKVRSNPHILKSKKFRGKN
jgi:hypothetical protein